MTDAMAHRGPDACGHWIEGAVGLGHRMLRSTSEAEHESQPLYDKAAQLCIVFDGRLDNREELVAMLETAGCVPRDGTDAEIVLRSYQAWGKGCPSRFLGDFGFALWDEPDQSLFCARDQIGIRPFYYFREGTRFWFASEIQPLIRASGVVFRPNQDALACVVAEKWAPPRQTLYEGIFRLPAAHELIVTRRGTNENRYWNVDPSREIRLESDAEYVEQFRELFDRAVRCRLRSGGTVAALVSGGIDSASVVATADAITGARSCQRVEGYSIAFEGFPDCDERKFVERLSETFGVTVNTFAFDPASRWFDFDRIGACPDVLYNVATLFASPALEAIKQRGIKVLLSGLGSDELLASGLDHLRELFVHAHFWGLLTMLRHDASVYAKSPPFLFANFCLKPVIPAFIKAIRRRAVLRLRLKEPNRFPARDPLTDSPSAALPQFQGTGQRAIYHSLFENYIATTDNDARSLFFAQFGVELRCPFLDRRIVEFAFAIPEDQRWRGTMSKFVLREAMKPIVPQEIRARVTKADILGPTEAVLMRRNDQIRALCDNSALVSLGVVGGADLKRKLKISHRSGRRDTFEIQKLVAAELWCRRALGGTPAREALTRESVR